MEYDFNEDRFANFIQLAMRFLREDNPGIETEKAFAAAKDMYDFLLRSELGVNDEVSI